MPTDLQSSENFKLAAFWEEKNASKDKSAIQQLVLKINLSEAALDGQSFAEGADLQRRDTMQSVQSQSTVVNKAEGNVGYQKMQTAYEPAPKDNINDNTDDQKKLQKLTSEITSMQAEIDTIMKKH